jgi:hypothetical protein
MSYATVGGEATEERGEGRKCGIWPLCKLYEPNGITRRNIVASASSAEYDEKWRSEGVEQERRVDGAA